MAVNFGLDGKVAIVTGASRGIGASIAKTLAANGASVVLCARKPDALHAVAAEIEAAGGKAHAHASHMGKPEDIDALVQAAIARFGQVDILVNNAATNPYFGPMLDIEWGAWDKTFEVNVKGYFHASRAVIRHLQERGATGSIVNVASVVGLMGAPFQGVYAMTKAAVISMTKTLAVELGPTGIRINAIAPGLIDTKFASALTSDDGIKNMIVEKTALKRVGVPDEIAGAALFLASDASAYVTGTTMVVDGGWTVG